MSSHSSNTLMTDGPIWKRIVAFAIPLFLGNLFQQLYNMADSLIVGNFLGSNALAAVSSSGNLIFLMVGFFNGMAVGAGVVIARYFGARDIEHLQDSIHTTIAFGLAAGILLGILGVLLAPQILLLMGTPAEVFPNSKIYFQIYFSGSLFFVMYNIFVGILQAVGDSKHPLYYLIISSVTNVILDLLFVALFHMGVGAGCPGNGSLSGFKCPSLPGSAFKKSGRISGLSKKNPARSAHVKTDHCQWSAGWCSEFYHRTCQRGCPVQYQCIWKNCHGGLRILFQN